MHEHINKDKTKTPLLWDLGVNQVGLGPGLHSQLRVSANEWNVKTVRRAAPFWAEA